MYGKCEASYLMHGSVCQIPSVIAVGVNCTPPRFIKPLLEAAVTAVKGQVEPPLLLAYPNSGEGWVNKTGKWDGNSDLQVGISALIKLSANTASSVAIMLP